MDVGILGPLTVAVNGRELAIPAPKQRALLALLVLRRNQVVSVESLVDEIWGEEAPSTATKIIHGYVSRLRKVLGADVLATRPSGYRLTLAPMDVDADRFEALFGVGCRRLATGEPTQAAADLGAALGLWRGAALAEFRFHGRAADELDRLADLRQLALEYHLEAEIAAGNHATATPELRMLVHEHPLRESLRGSLMLALYRAGRQAEALAVYADTRRVLVGELGVEPSESLQHLQAAILAHDPSLRWAGPPTVAGASSFRPGSRAGRAWTACVRAICDEFRFADVDLAGQRRRRLTPGRPSPHGRDVGPAGRSPLSPVPPSAPPPSWE